MESEGEEDEAPFEEFGAVRLPLKSGTASGYLGVQRSKSKKNPWQAIISNGTKRYNVGSFKTRTDAAVARAEAKASGAHLLPSPRKQAPRNSGVCHPPTVGAPVLSHSILTALLDSAFALFSEAVEGSGPHAPDASGHQRAECR